MLVEPFIIFIASIISYNNVEQVSAAEKKSVQTEIKSQAQPIAPERKRGGWDGN